MRLRGYVLLALLMAGVAMPARADIILYITDGGNIGQVDVTTKSVVPGSVHNTGLDLTDIAFDSAGTLFGTTFYGLYSVNPNDGSSKSLIVYKSIGSGLGMNALTGSGGTNLWGAANVDQTVYGIDPINGTVSYYATSPAPSAGDLAISGTTLYESAVEQGHDELVNITTNSIVGFFHVDNPSGAELNDLFGLTFDGTTMYGVSGTIVYSVNLSNAVLTELFDYSAAENHQNLGQSTGAAFMGHNIPEPTSLLLISTGIAGIKLAAWRRKK